MEKWKTDPTAEIDTIVDIFRPENEELRRLFLKKFADANITNFQQFPALQNCVTLYNLMILKNSFSNRILCQIIASAFANSGSVTDKQVRRLLEVASEAQYHLLHLDEAFMFRALKLNRALYGKPEFWYGVTEARYNTIAETVSLPANYSDSDFRQIVNVLPRLHFLALCRANQGFRQRVHKLMTDQEIERKIKLASSSKFTKFARTAQHFARKIGGRDYTQANDFIKKYIPDSGIEGVCYGLTLGWLVTGNFTKKLQTISVDDLDHPLLLEVLYLQENQLTIDRAIRKDQQVKPYRKIDDSTAADILDILYKNPKIDRVLLKDRPLAAAAGHAIGLRVNRGEKGEIHFKYRDVNGKAEKFTLAANPTEKDLNHAKEKLLELFRISRITNLECIFTDKNFLQQVIEQQLPKVLAEELKRSLEGANEETETEKMVRDRSSGSSAVEAVEGVVGAEFQPERKPGAAVTRRRRDLTNLSGGVDADELSLNVQGDPPSQVSQTTREVSVVPARIPNPEEDAGRRRTPLVIDAQRTTDSKDEVTRALRALNDYYREVLAADKNPEKKRFNVHAVDKHTALQAMMDDLIKAHAQNDYQRMREIMSKFKRSELKSIDKNTSTRTLKSIASQRQGFFGGILDLVPNPFSFITQFLPRFLKVQAATEDHIHNLDIALANYEHSLPELEQSKHVLDTSLKALNDYHQKVLLPDNNQDTRRFSIHKVDKYSALSSMMRELNKAHKEKNYTQMLAVMNGFKQGTAKFYDADSSKERTVKSIASQRQGLFGAVLDAVPNPFSFATQFMPRFLKVQSATERHIQRLERALADYERLAEKTPKP